MHPYRRLITTSCLALFAILGGVVFGCNVNDPLAPAVPLPSGEPEVALSCTAGLAISQSIMLATWIPADSSVELHLPIVRSKTRSPRCNTAVRNPIAAAFEIENVTTDGDSIVRVDVRPRRRGFGRLILTLNQKIAAVNVFVASREFADAAIGHRGGGGLWPENTLEAVLAGARSHLRASEMDIRLTKDTVPVLMHDVTIDRTTTGTGSIERYTFADLDSFEIQPTHGQQFGTIHVPSLEQILAATVDTHHHLVLDVKRDGQTILPPDQEARLVVNLIRQYGAEDRVTLSSTSQPFLIAARAASPTIDLGLFDWGYRPEYLAFSRRIHATSITHHPDSLLLPRMAAIMDSLRAAGITVYASTTDRVTQADSLIQLRSIHNILTDIPPRTFRDPKLPAFVVITPP